MNDKFKPPFLKSLFERNPEYSKNKIRTAVKSLSIEQQKLVFSLYGNDLDGVPDMTVYRDKYNSFNREILPIIREYLKRKEVAVERASKPKQLNSYIDEKEKTGISFKMIDSYFNGYSIDDIKLIISYFTASEIKGIKYLFGSNYEHDIDYLKRNHQNAYLEKISFERNTIPKIMAYLKELELVRSLGLDATFKTIYAYLVSTSKFQVDKLIKILRPEYRDIINKACQNDYNNYLFLSLLSYDERELLLNKIVPMLNRGITNLGVVGEKDNPKKEIIKSIEKSAVPKNRPPQKDFYQYYNFATHEELEIIIKYLNPKDISRLGYRFGDSIPAVTIKIPFHTKMAVPKLLDEKIKKMVEVLRDPNRKMILKKGYTLFSPTSIYDYFIDDIEEDVLKAFNGVSDSLKELAKRKFTLNDLNDEEEKEFMEMIGQVRRNLRYMNEHHGELNLEKVRISFKEKVESFTGDQLIILYNYFDDKERTLFEKVLNNIELTNDEKERLIRLKQKIKRIGYTKAFDKERVTKKRPIKKDDFYLYYNLNEETFKTIMAYLSPKELKIVKLRFPNTFGGEERELTSEEKTVFNAQITPKIKRILELIRGSKGYQRTRYVVYAPTSICDYFIAVPREEVLAIYETLSLELKKLAERKFTLNDLSEDLEDVFLEQVVKYIDNRLRGINKPIKGKGEKRKQPLDEYLGAQKDVIKQLIEQLPSLQKEAIKKGYDEDLNYISSNVTDYNRSNLAMARNTLRNYIRDYQIRNGEIKVTLPVYLGIPKERILKVIEIMNESDKSFILNVINGDLNNAICFNTITDEVYFKSLLRRIKKVVTTGVDKWPNKRPIRKVVAVKESSELLIEKTRKALDRLFCYYCLNDNIDFTIEEYEEMENIFQHPFITFLIKRLEPIEAVVMALYFGFASTKRKLPKAIARFLEVPLEEVERIIELFEQNYLSFIEHANCDEAIKEDAKRLLELKYK